MSNTSCPGIIQRRSLCWGCSADSLWPWRPNGRGCEKNRQILL